MTTPSFAYEAISAAQVQDIETEVTAASAAPVITWVLLAAWEADHAAHVALLAQAQTNADDEAIALHERDIATLEAAIAAGRTAAGPMPAAT